jgi:hypothetical protein
MKRAATLILLAFLASVVAAPHATAQAPAISAAEARDIATDAYLYFYPLVTMDLTRKQLTNIKAGSGMGGPANTFDNIPAFPTADMRAVVRPNFDTLYSSGWVDLTREPMVISVPDTGGRYYLIPMLDMWTDVFASPGCIQKGFKITSLSGWGKPPVAIKQTIDPSVDVKTPPKEQVDTMTGEKFFAYAAELLKVNPPHITDEPIIARLKRIGLEAGKSFDTARLDPSVRKAIDDAPAQAQKLMEWKKPTLARVVNGWSMNTDTMGVYGNYYLKRAMVAQLGLGANLPEDAIYPLNLGDENGKPLDGTNKYVIRFTKEDAPPVEAFWSVTLYDPEGFQVANPVNRFAVSSWMPFKRDADGSLTLYIQYENPGGDRESNWLPAPKGPFNLTMRLYAPKSEALTGVWNPPSVKPVEASATVGGK